MRTVDDLFQNEPRTVKDLGQAAHACLRAREVRAIVIGVMLPDGRVKGFVFSGGEGRDIQRVLDGLALMTPSNAVDVAPLDNYNH